MTDDDYITRLLEEVDKRDIAGAKGVFRVDDKMSDDTANAIKRHFLNKPEYSLTMKKCKQCQGTWEVMIYFVRK